MEDVDIPPDAGKHTPPKDFVCPITSNIFDDPVTLETGQTYERKAIQEWLQRGSSTCPITRQRLRNNQLPKTNYVLKRLIGSWQEQNSTPIRSERAQSENKASIILLRRVIKSSDERTASEIAKKVVSDKAFESVVDSLGSEMIEERVSAVFILLRCILEDGKCRNIIADKVHFAPILESFIRANDEEQFEIVRFLSELVKLNRRTVNKRLLRILKDEGIGSTMHTLLIYLQRAEHDQCPIVAGLLLQLDLLAEPRSMSIYREEAIDALISCLRNSEFPSAQIAAAETILSLHGRFSSSGKPLTRAYLLKCAGLGRKYESTMRKDKIQKNKEEDEAAENWDRNMASILVSHEFGLLFEALSEGLKSRYAELSSACFVSATWLIHTLSVLPDTGILGAARVCLLKRFVSIFMTANDTEDKALSMLALRSFIREPEGFRDLTVHMKDIAKVLRELKKHTSMASEMLQIFSEEHENSADFWNHKEIVQQDCNANGEVHSIIFFKGKYFSGHSDGTIKVWSVAASNLHLVQEIRDHTKAVTSLTIHQSDERIYSGSLDKTVMVWSFENEVLCCEQVYEMKDHVNNLVVVDSISCFIPQGAGIKVHSWKGAMRALNSNKYVRCLALLNSKLYCGCQDSSIQVIDLATVTLSTIQSGTRKILGKASPVYAMQVHDGMLYAASSSADGTAVKIWSTSNDTMVRSLPSTMEVRTIAITSELIYLGGKGGSIEVWCKKKYNRVETLQTGTSGKVNCMTFDKNDEFFVIGTSDGRIQVWGMS